MALPTTFISKANTTPAVTGQNTSPAGGVGVHGVSNSKGAFGVLGESIDGRGVVAISTNDYGLRAGSTNSAGIRGSSVKGRGVEGWGTAAEGVVGISVTAAGVIGTSEGVSKMQDVDSNGPGVVGTSKYGPGVVGLSEFGPGLVGIGNANLGAAILARGALRIEKFDANISGITVSGGGTSIETEGGINVNDLVSTGPSSSIGINCSGLTVGIAANCSNGYAGLFSGKVSVVGTLDKTGGGFKIDHPLDPANQYLSHSFVESPTRSNMYDGIATLDANGDAIVAFPNWFETLNHNFRYQLTAIGEAAPNIHVAGKIRDSRFRISGGKPGAEISWQVTGTRKDAWAQHNPVIVEEAKPETEKGTYLHPRLFGEPESKAFGKKTISST